jgi:phosphate transport system substrate-binding protein
MVFLVNVFRRTVATSAIAATVVLSPLVSAIAQQATQLNGAGATFPAPLYSAYFRAFQEESGIQVNYQAVGSGAGIRQVIAGTVDFGGTDAFMTADQIGQVGDRGVILVPTAGGAVAVVYNLPGVSGLRLSSTVLPDIFAGQITRWNDPRIVADNPGVTLPDLPIRSVVRADSSGTTSIFTNHLSAISPYFQGRIGAGTAPRWTTNPIRANGNPGVAAQVQRTQGSIGYVEYAYAKSNNIPTALVQNRNTNEFVAPSLQTAQEALTGVQFDADFRAASTNPARGYPIVGITWMMVYKDYPGAPETEAAVERMVDWVLTDGQQINSTLDYVSIPPDVAARARQAVDASLGN